MEADALRKHLGSKDLDHPANCCFALKIMKKSEVVRLKQVEHIKNEKEILTEVNHPFIVVLCAPPPPASRCCCPEGVGLAGMLLRRRRGPFWPWRVLPRWLGL